LAPYLSATDLQTTKQTNTQFTITTLHILSAHTPSGHACLSWIPKQMRQPSHRRRAKRLLNLLKELQDSDCTITHPTLFAIKHLLLLHSRCKLIEVKIDSLAANSPLECCRSHLPKFIVSQLEAQRLTDHCSESVSVPTVVAFVIQSLPSGCDYGKSYPTLFRWYHPPRHRTYYVFAHIQHNMPRQTYTVTELLALRATQASGKIMAMAANPELGTFGDRPTLYRFAD
jgi:hypothetical protein